MQDNENKNDNEQPNGSEGGFNWKGLILLFVAMSLFGLALWSKSFSDSSKNLTFAEFKQLVATDRIYVDETAKPPKLLRLVQKDGSSKQFVTGWYAVENPEENNGNKYSEFSTPIILEFAGEELKTVLSEKNLEISDLPTDSDGLGMMLMSFYLPIFFLLILLYFLFRHQIKAAGKGAMSFGKSKAKLMAMDKNKVTFKDVAGVEEAKEEVWEIVEYLRDPKKFQKLGGRIPKGVLMVGSPGTGKTLLARAIAGEADVPFFSISGSDFVEMFVGVGASRVRDMFEQGKKNAPCLIFIDEIDAVGRHRGHGLGGGHDEREQTLNALLVEMDGFDTQEGVIIIAATNRPDVLDPALLRPGRFDREITVSLPDVKGREEILNVHSKKVKLAENVDMGVIARGTPGYSGAELANVINEAALLAARKGLKAITNAELEEARDKVRWGKERRSLALSEEEKELTAYHEAGHALLGMLVKDTDPVHKVTIIPRGPALGVTMYLPVEDKHSYKKQYLLDRLILIMGGRVAEELVFGDVTNGAAGDIRQASEIARKMVCNWGMSDKLGMIEYGEGQGEVFLARDISSPRNYSEETAKQIDEEVKRFTDDAYTEATRLLTENRDKLEAIAKALLLYETIDGKHIEEIMEHGEIQNPPSAPTPPDLPEEEKKTPVVEDKEKEDDGDFSGELAPAGA
ncbi:MAG: ATP-dependent zinc metalloprotease FtsH [Verrucomicrobiales bacterium]|jgi:cell division protease FtsH|nr:ATP-dependent zinc metalloprotease FtsH [Verrucomicrobiales bacterium]